MLWYKSWLETRGKLVLALFYAIFPIPWVTLTRQNLDAAHSTVHALQFSIAALGLFYAVVPLLLAGSGIKTQTLRTQRGCHASMSYTLSLPVSRLQLLATRATLGFIEVAALLIVVPAGVLILLPPLRDSSTASALFEYWVTLCVCGLMFYSIGVLLSTFLDDLVQTWSSMFVVIGMFVMTVKVHVPPVLDVFGAMGKNSPLFTHSLPWAPMGVALVSAAILFSVAATVVRAREY
jgi:hypothetical protein